MAARTRNIAVPDDKDPIKVAHHSELTPRNGTETHRFGMNDLSHQHAPGSVASGHAVRRRNALVKYVAASLCVTATALPAPSLGQTAVPDEVSCPACRITSRTVTVLDGRDEGAIAGPPITVRLDGRERFWVIDPGELPLVFSPQGRFIAAVGRIGSGPGELQQVIDAVPVPGDSVLLLDNGLERATLVMPDLRIGRSIRVPGVSFQGTVLQWPTAVAVSARMHTPAQIGWPMHILSLTGGGYVVRSFGANGGELRPGDPQQLNHVLWSTGAGELWSAAVWEYTLIKWDRVGRPLATVTRRPEWFARPSRPGIGTASTPPPPTIAGISVESGGLLWVFIRVPSRSWRTAWPSDSRNASEISTRAIAFDRLYHTVVEVIDPTHGVIARARFELAIVYPLPDRRMAVYELGSDGIPQIRILELRIER